MALTGCTGGGGTSLTVEAGARALIVPASIPGKIMQGLTGSGERLVAGGKIDHHRRILRPDGVEIDVWVINSKHLQRGTVVLLHPLLTSKSWFLPLAEKLADAGWDAVLIDHRAHGRSGGKYITWGAKEKHDVKAVMDALVADKTVSPTVYALGSSMGGLVAIQYAALDPRCRGVLAVAPPADARRACRRILMMAGQKDFEAAFKRAGEIADFDPESSSAVAAAAKLNCPLLLVHGIWDVIVPYSHSREILRAAPGPGRIETLYFQGHAPEIGRSGWLVKQVAVLAEMGDRSSNDAERQASGPSEAARADLSARR